MSSSKLSFHPLHLDAPFYSRSILATPAAACGRQRFGFREIAARQSVQAARARIFENFKRRATGLDRLVQPRGAALALTERLKRKAAARMCSFTFPPWSGPG